MLMAADGLHKNCVHTESPLHWELWFSVIHYARTEKAFFSACSYVLPLFAAASTDLVNMHLAMVKIFSISNFTFIHLDQGFS